MKTAGEDIAGSANSESLGQLDPETGNSAYRSIHSSLGTIGRGFLWGAGRGGWSLIGPGTVTVGWLLVLTIRSGSAWVASTLSKMHHLARAAHSLAVAMSALRRNHAGCRAALRRGTPPLMLRLISAGAPYESASPASISVVLRRAHWLCVSHSSDAVWLCARYSRDAPPMTILAVTRYGNPSALTATATRNDSEPAHSRLQIP